VAFFHDLEQHVEGLRVRLLDLVEHDDAVRAAAQRLGELPGVLVTDVAGWRAGQAGDRMPLHELAHVELDEGVLAAEHEFGQHFGQLGLADARRPQEDERPDRAAGVLQPGAGPAHGLADRVDRLVLADDALVQLGFHLQQPLGFLLGDGRDRDAGPHADHFRHVFRRQAGALGFRIPVAAILLELGLELLDLLAHALALVFGYLIGHQLEVFARHRQLRFEALDAR